MEDNMKSDNKENKKETGSFLIILSVLSLVAISVMLVGITFSYFTGKIKGPDETNVLIKSSNIMLTYEQLNEINDRNIYPGWEKELYFNIKNESTETSLGKYEISLEIFTPLYTTEIPDFVYELEGISTAVTGTDVIVSKGTTMIPIETKAVGIGTIANGVTHNYTLRLKMIETNQDQSRYTDKAFSAKVTVVRVPSV